MSKHRQCCQLGDFVAESGDFPEPPWQLDLSRATNNKNSEFLWSLGDILAA